jgi:hypothetical protein
VVNRHYYSGMGAAAPAALIVSTAPSPSTTSALSFLTGPDSVFIYPVAGLALGAAVGGSKGAVIGALAGLAFYFVGTQLTL